ncbi:SH3 domain-containing protein [Pelomonas sp. BJYL3]|uniref:SH3 domain-containing protein n=1 Tax=Pelomonas sp. BJYL3 TaxID=2976697 RepID=UPI0022B5184D|nr:SH3 domain-containing protein [Pelomonas sp. BJYL3]
MARIEEERSSWRNALIDSNLIGKQVRELAGNTIYAQMAKDLKALQSPAISIAKQYEDLLSSNSAIGSAYKAWQESERAQLEKMRKMFDPMADIRKSVLGDATTQQLVKELTDGSSMRSQMKAITDQALGIGSVAKMLAQQAEDSRAQTKKLLEGLGVGSSIQSYLKDFEHINKQWKVPNEVLGLMGPVKELQEQLGLGKVALPTIDWGSAAALARAMGPEGIQEQLALLGIEPDGSMNPKAGLPEKGILSKKQTDVITLISFLLIFVIFFYQEYNSSLQQAKTEAFQAQTAVMLQVQAKQIQNLTTLIEKTLVQAAQEPEERLVVRDRIATVRSKPEHGSAIEGQLMPNEVVRETDKDGKWVEIEYYHWLHEEYRTGWVLKKYLERVPANYAKARRQ